MTNVKDGKTGPFCCESVTFFTTLSHFSLQKSSCLILFSFPLRILKSYPDELKRVKSAAACACVWVHPTHRV